MKYLNLFSVRILSATVLSSVLFLTACSDKGSVGVGSVDSEKEMVLDSIFEDPTPAEKQVLLDSFFGKLDMSGSQAAIIMKDTIGEAGAESEIWIVRHKSDEAVHYGAVLFPLAVTDSLPVLLFCHWGDAGVDVGNDVASLLSFASSLAENTIIVVPSFRSETLSMGDSVWTSTGEPSPWKLDVLDGIRLISSAESLAVAEHRPLISKGVRRAIGFSRGGGVALLASLHDKRFDRVVDFFGPTDFYSEFVRGVMTDLQAGNPIGLPGSEFLDTSLVKGLENGVLTLADVRRELLLRSPARFAAQLPAVQIQHGDADEIVPVSQAYALENALKADAPDTYAKSRVIIHKDGGHSPFVVRFGASDASEFLLGGLTLNRKLILELQTQEPWTPVTPFPSRK